MSATWVLVAVSAKMAAASILNAIDCVKAQCSIMALSEQPDLPIIDPPCLYGITFLKFILHRVRFHVVVVVIHCPQSVLQIGKSCNFDTCSLSMDFTLLPDPMATIKILTNTWLMSNTWLMYTHLFHLVPASFSRRKAIPNLTSLRDAHEVWAWDICTCLFHLFPLTSPSFSRRLLRLLSEWVSTWDKQLFYANAVTKPARVSQCQAATALYWISFLKY